MDLKNFLKKIYILAKLNLINRQRLKLTGLIKIAIILLIIVLPSIYFYQKYRRTQALLANPDKLAQEQRNLLLEKVAKIIQLPQGETPELRTVIDINQVRSNPFFDQAENGDKLLIYYQAKKAFLYRPSTNQIINVGPVNFTPKSATNSGTLITPKENTPTISL